MLDRLTTWIAADPYTAAAQMLALIILSAVLVLARRR
jgi:hypothetical protein